MDWHSRENIPGPSSEFRDRGPGWNRKAPIDMVPPTEREPYMESPVKHHMEKVHEERPRIMLHGERNRETFDPRYRFEDPTNNFVDLTSNDQMYRNAPPPPDIRKTDNYGPPPGEWGSHGKKDMREYPPWDMRAFPRGTEEIDMNRKHPNELRRISPDLRRKSRDGLEVRPTDIIPRENMKYPVENRQRVGDLDERKFRRREDDFDPRKTEQPKPFPGPREAVPDVRVDRRQMPEPFRGRDPHLQREPQRVEPRFKVERPPRESRVLQEDLPQRFNHDRVYSAYEEPCYATEEICSDLPPEENFSTGNDVDFRPRKERGRFIPKDDYIPRERDDFPIQKGPEHSRFQEDNFDTIRKRELAQRKEKEDLRLLHDEYNKKKEDFRQVKVKADLRVEERRPTRRDDFELSHENNLPSRSMYNSRRAEFKPHEDDLWIDPDETNSSKLDDFMTQEREPPETSFTASKRREDLKRERDNFMEDINYDTRRRVYEKDATHSIDEGKTLVVVREHPEIHERVDTKRVIPRRTVREEHRTSRAELRDPSPRRHRHISPAGLDEASYVPPSPRVLHERARLSFDIARKSPSPPRRLPSPRRRVSPRRLSPHRSRSPIHHHVREDIHLSHPSRSRSPVYHRGPPPERMISPRRRRSPLPRSIELSPSRIQDRLREVEEKLRRVEQGEIELSRKRSITPPPPVPIERDCRQILNQKRSAFRKVFHEESPPRINARLERRRRSPSPFRQRKPVFNRLDRKRI